MMQDHIVFFDGDCPFCHKAVRHLMEIDVHERLAFAPLNGETAARILVGPQQGLKKANSLVLVENYRSTERAFWIRAKAALRTYWLIGNGWGLVGIFSYLPAMLIDPFYKWIALHRHQFKLKVPLNGPKDRFLP